MSNTATPKKQGRPRGPKKKPENEMAARANAPQEGGPSVTVQDPAGAPPGTDAPPRPGRGPRPPKGQGRPAPPPSSSPESTLNEPALRPPTKPYEVPPDTGEAEAAAAVAAAPKGPDGKPVLTVNIAKLQAMTMTELNNM